MSELIISSEPEETESRGRALGSRKLSFPGFARFPVSIGSLSFPGIQGSSFIADQSSPAACHLPLRTLKAVRWLLL